MSKKDQVRMPSGMAGILKYSEEPKETIKIKPEYVIYFSIFLIMLEIILKFYG
ncbi:MAG: preprotein translocase subunit Sec61beta [Candidatus Aenigmarchaeota archaeon]|nr:preprotein translocase subunit Sec61beta [Candidatus Aenigmarchaeota archaeon]